MRAAHARVFVGAAGGCVGVAVLPELVVGLQRQLPLVEEAVKHF